MEHVENLTQNTVARVVQIWRYPVKSMMGEELDRAEVAENGIPGDRAWAVRDEKRGGIRGAKKIPQLMKLRAKSIGDTVSIIAENNEMRRVTDSGINQWLSSQLSHPVSLWPLLPADQLDHYRRGAPDSDDWEEELRTVMGRLPGEPLPDFSQFADLLKFESPPGTYFDAFPILIMSQQTLTTMSDNYPESNFDVRRFRPNLVLDISDTDEPFPEHSWVGKTINVGSASLDIVSTCPRCSMTTHAFAELPKDPKIMRNLVEQTKGELGVYAKIRAPGDLGAGDPVSIVA